MAIIKVGMVYWARLLKGKREKKGGIQQKEKINQSIYMEVGTLKREITKVN